MEYKINWSIVIALMWFATIFTITCLDYNYDYDKWTYAWLFLTIITFLWLLQETVRSVIKYELKKFKYENIKRS